MAQKKQSIETLLDQAESLMDRQDYQGAVRCLRRAQAQSPFRQDIRELLAEAIDGRLATTGAPLDTDFSSRDFKKTRTAPPPKVRRRRRTFSIGFGAVLFLLVAGLVGAVGLSAWLQRAGDQVQGEQSQAADDTLADAPATPAELLEEARDAMASRHYEDALALLDEAMELGPEDPAEVRELYAETYSRRGRQGFDAGRYQRAKEDYLRATEFDPDNPEHFYSLGWSNYYLGVEQRSAGNEREAHELLDAAAEAFRQSIELDRTEAKNHRSLGQALIQLGDREGAFAAWFETIRLGPNSRDAQRAEQFLESYGMSTP